MGEIMKIEFETSLEILIDGEYIETPVIAIVEYDYSLQFNEYEIIAVRYENPNGEIYDTDNERIWQEAEKEVQKTLYGSD